MNLKREGEGEREGEMYKAAMKGVGKGIEGYSLLVQNLPG